MGSPVLGAFRLFLYLTLTLTLIPVQAALVALKSRHAAGFPVFYHRLCTRILGFRLRVIGTPSTLRPTLFVSNHASYLDITMLGALLPASFVAKSEVGTWPLFGLLAKLQRTVFVDRVARNAVTHRDEMRRRLEEGDSLILFPEGTSSDGNRTLPFKTALFSVASLRVGDRPLTVQPVSITCTDLDSIPLGRTLRYLYAWYGDMELAQHLWQMVQLGVFTVVVEFHPPLTVESAGSRKALADQCWAAVASGVERAASGRLGKAA